MKVIARLGLIALVAMLAGCATPINWQVRVGAYTCDQAIMDYGPPDRSAKLSDGTTVSQWMTDRGETIVTTQPYVYGPPYYGPVGMGYSTTSFPAQYLQLTFSPDGKLKAWKRISK